MVNYQSSFCRSLSSAIQWKWCLYMRACAFAAALTAATAVTVMPSSFAMADQSTAGLRVRHSTALELAKGPSGFNPNAPLDESVLLECNPPGGAHPQAGKACAALNRVNGDLRKLKANAGSVCPKIYQPVTVVARGEWKGRNVLYRKVFGNECELQSATGAVFDF
ncbi:SSI family serine proteinase inhibitor [Streptomyces sirii]|uniref:SSI family serine proteinase inhibitor n=1 Tax=Streptomyces sirii TaxID=3127701 RepID=UPI003D369BF2